MKKFSSIFAFIATVVLCLLLLVFAAYLPQGAIERNIKESAEIMVTEGMYPRVGDHAYSAQLDNFTDAIMLMASQFTTADQMESILTNPMVGYDGVEDYTDFLYRYVQGEPPAYEWSYNRYWMGFRAILRLALVFLNYYQIKRYLAFLLFVLFSVLMCTITKKVSYQAGIAFAVSILLIRPYVICNGLQLSCCFLIAFLAMLLVPWIHRNSRYEKLFFMEIGMLTMYFDFYTVPIVTFGLPMVYLYLLRAEETEKHPVRRILSNALVWFAAYVSMWICKLLLTAIFTGENALEVGFGKLQSWLGFGNNEIQNAEYSPFTALIRAATSVVADVEGAVIWAVAVLLIFCLLLHMWRKGRIDKAMCRKHMGMPLLACLPIIWFMVAAEPTTMHFWFQYRSISLTYWAIGAYFCLIQTKSVQEITVLAEENEK